MTLIMETTKSIVAKEPMGEPRKDVYNREPFIHPKLQAVDNLTIQGAKDIAGKRNLSALAADVGLIDVVRWKPKNVCTETSNMRQVTKLQQSGADVVLNGAIMAIIGAVTLQHGAAVASQVVRERILSRLQEE
jgi:large subunit ribosomal protein L15